MQEEQKTEKQEDGRQKTEGKFVQSSRSGGRPRIAITMGDPAGIGPEIILQALAVEEIYALCQPVIYGDVEWMQKAARLLPMKIIEPGVGVSFEKLATRLTQQATDAI